MPCSDGGYGAECDRRERSDEVRKLTARNDKLAQMLCWICGTLTSVSEIQLIASNPALVDWWEKHQETDTNRVYSKMLTILKKRPDMLDDDLAKYFLAQATDVHAVSNYHTKWFYRLATKAYNEVNSVKTKEQLRLNKIEAAKNKLTPEEKKLLGIKIS